MNDPLAGYRFDPNNWLEPEAQRWLAREIRAGLEAKEVLVKRALEQAAERARLTELYRRQDEWKRQESHERKKKQRVRAVFGVADRKTGLRIRKALARPIELDPAHQRNVWHEFGPEDAYT